MAWVTVNINGQLELVWYADDLEPDDKYWDVGRCWNEWVAANPPDWTLVRPVDSAE